MERSPQLVLSSGGILQTTRPRSAGVLDAEEFACCRANGVMLGYDPVQIGWVPLDAYDDLAADAGDGEVAGDRELAGERARADGGPVFVFRPWRTEDLDAYERMLSSRALWRYVPEPYPEPFTREVAETLLEIARAELGTEVRAVEHAGEPIGQVRLVFGGAEPRVAEVSYWLAEERWGRGLMSRLLSEYTRRSFRHHAIDRIDAWIRPDNVGSTRAAARAGYRHDPSVSARRDGAERHCVHRADCVDVEE